MYHMVIDVDSGVEHALACAERVAKLLGEPDEEEVTLAHNFTDNPSGASATQVHSIQEADGFLKDRDIEYDVNESSSDPAGVIIEFAGEKDTNLIVTAGRERSPAGKVLFRSVTRTMILNSDRPVMVTGSTKRKR